MRSKNEAGISTLLVTLLLALLVGIGAMISGRTVSSLRAGKHLELRDEIRSLQRIFSTKLNCHRTLNTTSATVGTLNCSSFSSVVPRTLDGVPLTTGGKIGTWTINARCENNSLVIGASRAGKDPITGVDISTRAFSEDIFEGESKFCQEYFAPGTTCTAAPYTLYRGMGSDGIECCRLGVETNQNLSGPRISIAYCRKDEYLAGGYSSCAPVDTGMTAEAAANYPPRFQEAFGMGVADGNFKMNRRSWTTDCFNAMGSNPTDSWSRATAICCPVDYRRK